MAAPPSRKHLKGFEKQRSEVIPGNIEKAEDLFNFPDGYEENMLVTIIADEIIATSPKYSEKDRPWIEYEAARIIQMSKESSSKKLL